MTETIAQLLYMGGSLAFFFGTLLLMGQRMGWWV